MNLDHVFTTSKQNMLPALLNTKYKVENTGTMA